MKEATGGQNHRFDTTQWSVVVNAVDSASPEFRTAMASLCSTYWLPLYAFLRQSGRSPADAGDLAQGFFAFLIEKRIHAHADPERGRFRTFLLAALKRFLSSESERAGRQKRGGNVTHVSMDADSWEERFQRDLIQDFSPEQMYDREWAALLFDAVLADVKAEYLEAGRIDRYEAFCATLMTPADSVPYAELGPRLGLSEDGVKSAARRLRLRFRERFRERLAGLVENPADVDGEIRHLISSLGDSAH